MISNENVVKYKVSQLFEIYICCFRVLWGMIHRTTPASSAQSPNPARPQLSRSGMVIPARVSTLARVVTPLVSVH